MNITVKGKQMDVGAALREHCNESLEAIFEKYFGTAVSTDIVFSKVSHFYTCSISSLVGRGILIQGEGEGGDAYAAFALASTHLAKRLRRHKRKLKDHHRNAEKREVLEMQAQILAAPQDDVDEPEEGDNPLIIAESSALLEKLTPSEAVMRLDLQNEPVLIFFNKASGRLNVVHRRNDGHIGWIDPENR